MSIDVKVLNGEYAVQDHTTGKILDTDEHWKMCVQTGQKINMSMTFQWSEPTLESCTDCDRSSEETGSIDLRWCVNSWLDKY